MTIRVNQLLPPALVMVALRGTRAGVIHSVRIDQIAMVTNTARGDVDDSTRITLVGGTEFDVDHDVTEVLELVGEVVDYVTADVRAGADQLERELDR
jgi:hypothetical protein